MNNKKGILILLLMTALLFIQCKKYTLSENDLEWQPYLKGDILIFKSNLNEIDTVYVTEIKSYSNLEDNLAISSDYHETLFVSSLVSLSRPKKDHLGNYYNKGTMELLSMYADDDSYIDFKLSKIGDSLSYPITRITIKNLQKKDFVKSVYNDILKIKANDFYIESEYDLQNFWWSKKYGYVRYEYKNNYYWELKKFIRDGKDILGGNGR